MPRAGPFTGLLYDHPMAGPPSAVTAPPYDTISPIDQDRYHRTSPYNVVRLILGKGEAGGDESSKKNKPAGSPLPSWRGQGIPPPTTAPAVYPHRPHIHLRGPRP